MKLQQPIATSAQIALKCLLARNSASKDLIRYLHPKDREQLAAILPPEHDPFATSLSLKEYLGRIHYSWWIPFLSYLEEEDKGVFCAALQPIYGEKLTHYFQMQKHLPDLSHLAKEYIYTTLFSHLISDQKEWMPIEFLPFHPLNCLLNLTKHQIQTLVDYLGLHDLALEMKRMVRAEQIGEVHKALSPKQRKYVEKLLRGKELIIFSPLHLNQWNGDREELQALLLQRGFNRLGKALFGCPLSLLWHISHRLDTGRAKILRKFFIDINNEQAQDMLTQQITELVKSIEEAARE